MDHLAKIHTQTMEKPGRKMEPSGQAPLKSEAVPVIRSEGNLVDEQKPLSHYDTADCQDNDLLPDWHEVGFQPVGPIFKTTNPFWNGLSASNPFLDDIAQLRNRTGTNVSILKEDPFLFFREVEEDSSSGDELNVHQFLRKSSFRKSGRSKSVSELLDILDGKLRTETCDQILPQDMEWLHHDREAYKMAWLSQRQLARSCLDLNTMSHSPGWAQTQVADTVVVCRLDHQGGSVQLPGSQITVHVPQGHIRTGEFQEVTLRAFLNPPESLNHDLSCTVSPLLELRLSNLNTMEGILLEMKISAEVRQDPFSQVMGMLTCLCSSNKGGPFIELSNCYIYKDTIQVKLLELSQAMYIVIAAQAKVIKEPATSVWDYIHRTLYVGIYGPKYIHPSFTAIFTLWGHSYMPRKLTINDLNRSGKNVSPVVFQLWGKHSFFLDQPHDLHISLLSCDLDFEVKEDDQRKEIKQERLKGGEAIHQQFLFSAMDSKALHAFVFLVQIHVPNMNPVAQFYVRTPEPAPNFSRVPNQPNTLQKLERIKSYPLFPAVAAKYPTFQDKTLHFISYGVALKTVLRQSKIDYFLEYFKGDTIALLGGSKVKAIGQTKVKEWYIGILRGKLGLVHCKNVKVISREQVIDMSESGCTTQQLLEQAALPFKRLTYIYSTVLTLVSEKILDWKTLADALGYSQLTAKDFDQMQVDKETERVSYVVKKLKEDCHADRNRRKFLYELVVSFRLERWSNIMNGDPAVQVAHSNETTVLAFNPQALLKIDCQGLVAQLLRETAILTSAVKLGKGWRELAEKLVRLTKQQIEAYEIPHRGKTGEVVTEMMWKPAYDFLYTWGAHYGESYQDVLQDLQLALDRMKNPVTKHWRELTGALILVNCLEVLRATCFCVSQEE